MTRPGTRRPFGAAVGTVAASALVVLCCVGAPVLLAWLTAAAVTVAGFLGAGGAVIASLFVGATALALFALVRRSRRRRRMRS